METLRGIFAGSDCGFAAVRGRFAALRRSFFSAVRESFFSAVRRSLFAIGRGSFAAVCGVWRVLGRAGVCVLVLPGVFAAAESARAQEAEFTIFEHASGAITVTLHPAQPAVVVGLSERVELFYGQLRGANPQLAALAVQLINEDGAVFGTVGALSGPDNLPVFVSADGTNMVVSSGDRIRVRYNALFAGGLDLWVYESGGPLFLAMSVATSTVLDTDQFYMNATGSTTVRATTNVGYSLTCPIGVSEEEDMLSCVQMTDEDCNAQNPGHVLENGVCQLATTDEQCGKLFGQVLNPDYDSTAAVGEENSNRCQCPDSAPLIHPVTQACSVATQEVCDAFPISGLVPNPPANNQCECPADRPMVDSVAQACSVATQAICDEFGVSGLAPNPETNQCECPTGMDVQGDTCVDIMCGENQVLVGDFCMCIDGASKDPNDPGRCDCPAGEDNYGDICLPIPDCSAGGMEEDGAGGCRCPAGEGNYGGTCLPIPDCSATGMEEDGIGGCRCNTNAGFADDGAGACMCNAEAGFLDDGANGCMCDAENGFLDNGGSCACPEGMQDDGTGVCAPIPAAKDDPGYTTFAGVAVGAVGVVLALHLWDGTPGAFSFSPDFGYAATESGYSYNYGARLNFAQDNWRIYWLAGQGNDNGDAGDWRYGSGGSYTGDFWRAAFSETVQGDEAEYDFSLSADWRGGIWRLSPVYRFNSRLDLETADTESRNSLDLEAAMQYNRWTIRPGAGFSWRRAEEFGDSARFQISAVRRF